MVILLLSMRTMVTLSCPMFPQISKLVAFSALSVLTQTRYEAVVTATVRWCLSLKVARLEGTVCNSSQTWHRHNTLWSQYGILTAGYILSERTYYICWVYPPSSNSLSRMRLRLRLRLPHYSSGRTHTSLLNIIGHVGWVTWQMVSKTSLFFCSPLASTIARPSFKEPSPSLPL